MTVMCRTCPQVLAPAICTDQADTRPDGFDLALHPVADIEPAPAFLHAGFKAPGPADVRTLLDRAYGITIVELHDKQPTRVQVP